MMRAFSNSLSLAVLLLVVGAGGAAAQPVVFPGPIQIPTLQDATGETFYHENGAGDVRSVWFGPNAGGGNPLGLNNLGGGNSALKHCVSVLCERNTAWGNKCGYYSRDTTSYGTCVGYTSFYENELGTNWAGLGANSGFRSQTDGNVFLGPASGYFTTWGARNLGSAVSAGSRNVNGNDGVFLGYAADFSVPGASTTASLATAVSGVDLGPHSYKVIFKFGSRRSTASTETLNITVTSGNRQVDLANIPVYGGALVGATREIYRSKAADFTTAHDGARKWYLLTTLNDNTTRTYADLTLDASLGALEPGNDAAIVLGSAAKCLFGHTLCVGSPSAPIADFYFGEGFEGSTQTAITFQPTMANGENAPGVDYVIAGGAGTGTGAGGAIRFRVSPPSVTSGLATNAPVDALVITEPLTAPSGQVYFVCVNDQGRVFSQASVCQ